MLARQQWLYTTRTYDCLLDDEAMPQNNGVPDEASLQRYVTKIVKPGGQAIPLPVGMLKYVGGVSTTVPGQPSIREPNYRLLLTHHLVPLAAVPIALINDQAPAASYTNGLLAGDLALGCVNSVAFPPDATNQRAPGTLLLESIDPVPEVSALGDRIYTITYTIAVFNPPGQLGTGLDANSHAIGHNHLLDKDGKYYEVSTDGTSNYPYVQNGTRRSTYLGVDFATLFRCP